MWVYGIEISSTWVRVPLCWPLCTWVESGGTLPKAFKHSHGNTTCSSSRCQTLCAPCNTVGSVFIIVFEPRWFIESKYLRLGWGSSCVDPCVLRVKWWGTLPKAIKHSQRNDLCSQSRCQTLCAPCNTVGSVTSVYLGSKYLRLGRVVQYRSHSISRPWVGSPVWFTLVTWMGTLPKAITLR